MSVRFRQSRTPEYRGLHLEKPCVEKPCVNLRERPSILRCAFCHGDGELSWVCKCGTVMHADCQAELGGCTTLGCCWTRFGRVVGVDSDGVVWAPVITSGPYSELLAHRNRNWALEEQARLDEQFAARDRGWDLTFVVVTTVLVLAMLLIPLLEAIVMYLAA